MTANLVTPDAAWRRAIAEHGEEVERFVAALAAVPGDAWHRAPAPGKWSPAAVALHVARAYEYGRDASNGEAAMRMLVSPWQAWVGRSIVLPLLLATKRFPRGARAPREVVPDLPLAERTTPDEAIRAVRQAAGDCIAQVHARMQAPGGTARVASVTHAYFGELSPRTALRLLSAHTRHHTQGLDRDGRRARPG